METSSEQPGSKKHVRQGSGRAPNVRRATKGPLDVDDSPLSLPATDPLSPTPSVFQSPKQITNQNPSISQKLLSPTSLTSSQSQFPATTAVSGNITPQRSTTPTRYGTPRAQTPRLTSPQSSNLSSTATASFKTAHSTLSHLAPKKDFSYLLRQEIYHPLTLLDVPPPFRISSSQPSPTTPLATLISTGHFRSAAITASSLLASPSLSPSNHAEIFSLVYTRLSCLCLCNATQLAAQEVKALEDLNSAYYRDEETGAHLVPWELRVLAVRLQGMGFNDARRGVMGYYDLARETRLTLTSLKKQAISLQDEGGEKVAVEEEIRLQTGRLEDLGLRVASALIEMEDLDGATRHLKSLTPAGSPGLKMQKALLYLYLGDIGAARSAISSPPHTPAPTPISTSSSLAEEEERAKREENVILALAHMGDSEYALAVPIWEELASSASSSSNDQEVAMYQQNLAVCYLYLGEISQAREILESLITRGHSFHALTFNLSTIYELCTERSRALKIGLAEQVAEMQMQIQDGGDGAGDEKAGVQGGRVGWEKVNGDFKL